MSEYLERLKLWSKNSKLIYFTPKWKKAIKHIDDIESKNAKLIEALSHILNYSHKTGDSVLDPDLKLEMIYNTSKQALTEV